MTQRHTSDQTQTLKLVISVGAIAATLGGWATLAWHQSTETPAASTEAAPTTTINAPEWLLTPPVIPTVQPLARSSNQPETASSAAAPSALRQVSAPVMAQAPAPVVLTRSSR